MHGPGRACVLVGDHTASCRSYNESLVSQQYPQIAQIISRWTSYNCIPHRLKKRVSIESRQVRLHIQPAGSSTVKCAAIDDCPGGGTVAVDAVGSGAQHRDCFAGNRRCAGQGKLLVTAAGATVRYLDGDLSS